MLLPPCPLDISPIDFGRADELIERALDDAREFIKSGGEDRAPIQMHMHRHASRSHVRRAQQPSPTER